MLTHLIILLDDTSVSYCHYEVTKAEHRLINIEDLRAGIMFAMKENLNVQIVYPGYNLSSDYTDVIETIDHSKVMPISSNFSADVVVLEDWQNLSDDIVENKTCLVKASRSELAQSKEQIRRISEKATRLNIVLTDIESFRDRDIDGYAHLLDSFVDFILDGYRKGQTPQLNLLTDRIFLNEMNNCNAGYSNVTLAPNGKFYLCPAFYYEDESHSVGDLKAGLDINNQQLLKIDHAPICRNCDAFQCKRCVWQNHRLTMDLNTPSHQQCVIAHIERNASRKFVMKLNKEGLRLKGSQTIGELNELDPFNNVNRWK